MSFDHEVLIIGAGMSGLGLAVQLVRKYGIRSFKIIEKSNDVGGTWLANTYPGCGCDVASHFYSYSFALNPDWSRKFSMRPEIQAYFRSVAEQYNIIPHIQFHTSVETASWDDTSQTWLVSTYDANRKRNVQLKAKILVAAVGSLSIPRECETHGAANFQGEGGIFHSAKWNHDFDWKDKDVVVLGNGCSATQFVPIMSGGSNAARKLTQFSQQAHYLSERENPYYSKTFKATMRYVPLAMRMYRAYHYYLMERDWAGFDVESGRVIREDLKKTNEEYVKKMAPSRYWDALIPKHEIGCKRKVLDTDYLACLNRPNIELIPDDPVDEITSTGVRTKSGRDIHADAIVLAIGFATKRMLFPMEIKGQNGITLNEHWDQATRGAPQAYFGTCVSGFPNFFITMGPNTVTGHLSVIYTVECQMNFILRVLDPIIRSLPSYRSRSLLPNLLHEDVDTVAVTKAADEADSAWIQREAKKLVWSSGCTNWAIDPKSNYNIMMYPDWQFWFWFRSVIFPRKDFIYLSPEGKEVSVKNPIWKKLWATIILGSTIGGVLYAAGRNEGELGDIVHRSLGNLRLSAKSLRHHIRFVT